MIKTFRGLLDDGEQEKIRLSTKKGKIGYRIVKFQIYPSQPGQQTVENNVMLWKIKQTSVSTSAIVIDFANGNLLGAGIYSSFTSSRSETHVVVFDREIFNQDIYITHTDTSGAIACNYYLELETINMSDNSAVVATLRDIRLNPQVGA